MVQLLFALMEFLGNVIDELDFQLGGLQALTNQGNKVANKIFQYTLVSLETQQVVSLIMISSYNLRSYPMNLKMVLTSLDLIKSVVLNPLRQMKEAP